MSLLEERVVYKPFEYPKAYDYWLKQQQAHWLHTEVPMAQDVTDWKSNMKDHEKNLIGGILKGFAQTETIVNDYWSTLVTKWFRKPEIIMMGTTLGSSETIPVINSKLQLGKWKQIFIVELDPNRDREVLITFTGK